MTKGQHVGGLSDSLVEDEGLSAARSQAKALAKLARPIERKRGPREDIGDGDPCPVVPAHGRMFYIQGSQVQVCTHQTHDGVWSREGKEPPTRSLWPQGHQSFATAVTEYHSQVGLPTLDITLEV